MGAGGGPRATSRPSPAAPSRTAAPAPTAYTPHRLPPWSPPPPLDPALNTVGPAAAEGHGKRGLCGRVAGAERPEGEVEKGGGGTSCKIACERRGGGAPRRRNGDDPVAAEHRHRGGVPLGCPTADRHAAIIATSSHPRRLCRLPL